MKAIYAHMSSKLNHEVDYAGGNDGGTYKVNRLNPMEMQSRSLYKTNWLGDASEEAVITNHKLCQLQESGLMSNEEIFGALGGSLQGNILVSRHLQELRMWVIKAVCNDFQLSGSISLDIDGTGPQHSYTFNNNAELIAHLNTIYGLVPNEAHRLASPARKLMATAFQGFVANVPALTVGAVSALVVERALRSLRA